MVAIKGTIKFDDFQKKHYTLLLGAGFSKWAANLPLAHELFDYNINPYGVKERKRLIRVIEKKALWNAMNPRGHPEDYVTDLVTASSDSLEDVIWYISRRLTEPFIMRSGNYGHRRTVMIDENYRLTRSGVQEAISFYQMVYGPSLSGIITTNYDLLALTLNSSAGSKSYKI